MQSAHTVEKARAFPILPEPGKPQKALAELRMQAFGGSGEGAVVEIR